MYLACTDSCLRRVSHSVVLSTFMVLRRKPCTCSHTSTIACYLGRPPDTTVGSYQWFLLGQVFGATYIACHVTQICGSIYLYYSTIDTLEGTEVPLFINITIYSKDEELAS